MRKKSFSLYIILLDICTVLTSLRLAVIKNLFQKLLKFTYPQVEFFQHLYDFNEQYSKIKSLESVF